jgi:uncharacterized protein involved in high-affinity Fe2+ transport
MKFITDRLSIIALGLLVIVVGLISPRKAKEEIFGEFEPEDPVELRKQHRAAFLKQHIEMTQQGGK